MPAARIRPRTLLGLVLAACALAAGCSADEPDASGAQAESVAVRIGQIQQAVDRWRDAPTLADARAAAEVARNLITGPDGPGYGDRDGDGVIGGTVRVGLLPGTDGSRGLASDVSECAGADLLGGSWDDPVQRWELMTAAIGAWTPANNPFPTLASHPQRVVGWAELTLAASSLDQAREYSGHAAIHVDASRVALHSC